MSDAVSFVHEDNHEDDQHGADNSSLDPDHDDDMIAGLTQRLSEAEAILQALVTGQVNTVLNNDELASVLLRHTQQALRQSQASYRHLVTRIPAVVFELAPSGTTLAVNEAVTKITGYAPDELIGKNWWDIFIPGQQRHQVDQLYRQWRSGDVTNVVLVLSAKNTAPVTIELTSANRYHPDGSLASIVGVGVDISERDRMVQELRTSRDQLAIILQGAADGITAQAPDGSLIYANATAAQLLGDESPAHLISTDVGAIRRRFDILDEDGKPLSYDRLPGRIALQTGQSVSAIIRFRKRDNGVERWSNVKATPVLNERGQPTSVVNIFQDITDIKRSEQAQRLLANAGNILATSRDYETMLQDVAQLAVPDMADWCAVHLIEEDASVQQLAVAHVDPGKVAVILEWQRDHPSNWDAPTGIPSVLRTGRSEFYPDIPDELITATIKDPERLAIVRSIGFSSVMIAPMIARGRTLGAITFVWAESRRHYTGDDLALAEEIGRRAGLAVDNTRLFRQAQQLNSELEQRVAERTAQLRATNVTLQTEITERRRAEAAVRTLNAQLEQRVNERTTQLQSANLGLRREIAVRRQAQETVRSVLRRTRELYDVSQRIGLARTPEDVLNVLLASSYLRPASYGSVTLLDRPHAEHESPPSNALVLVDQSRETGRPHFAGTRYPIHPDSVDIVFPRTKVIQVSDLNAAPHIPEQMLSHLPDLGSRSLLSFPLIANGQWNGAMSFHFLSPGILDKSDVRHIQGLVDQAAVAIHNMRLLEMEAEARREAEKANELRLKFLAMISHELRTPLTSIKGFATTLLAQDVSWDELSQRDFISTINEEADKLTEMIEQLLDLSRLDAGLLRVRPAPCALSDIVSAAMSQLQAITSNHTLNIHIPDDLPSIKADTQRVAQVLTNLVDNAAKYSPRRSDIAVRAFTQGDTVQVDVSDQGIGIPPEERIYIFEAFRRGEGDSNKRTKGAGLAICKGLIEAHGGRIWIQEREGPGTTASFTLPVASTV
ncbi:MAG: PAS domain S-box protein [Chloroflexi bacterium]|nr:PAS domain S-box protein [Chloroflexota bacterium]